MNRPVIVGTGQTKFGKHIDRSLRSLAGEAIGAALADAGLQPADIDMAFVANSMAAIVTGQVATIGQGILRYEGFSNIPVFNVDNACASSSSALSLAVHALQAGAAETVLVVGVEKLVAEDKTLAYKALNGAADLDFLIQSGVNTRKESVFITAVYPKRIADYESTYGLDPEMLARISVKNRAQAAHNPIAQFVKPITIEEVLGSRVIAGPITALMCAPIGDGAAAVVLSTRPRESIGQQPVQVLASVIGMGSSPGGKRSIERVAECAYQQAGITPSDVHVAEVHDSTSFNELLAYEELGFCAPGQGAGLVKDASTALGGRLPVNTSGGLESRGHPVAATGLAQIVELADQLRGRSGDRQVAGAKYGLAENAGGYAKDDTAAIAITILGI